MPEANVPLNITITAEATETLAWRSLARQAVPMLTRPEQFHISQRQQLAQNICLLLTGDLEMEDVLGNSEEEHETGFGEDNGDHNRKEARECE